MSAAYDIAALVDLFVPRPGRRPLAGLVFVAVSINLEQVLDFPGLPDRALATLTLLLGPVVVSLFCLVPQSLTAFGIELVVRGAVWWRRPRCLRGGRCRRAGQRAWVVGRMTIAVLGTVPFAVAGSASSPRRAAGSTGRSPAWSSRSWAGDQCLGAAGGDPPLVDGGLRTAVTRA